jgi:pimeloyl-ACP methyl ester carboxylesterase
MTLVIEETKDESVQPMKLNDLLNSSA